MVQGVHKIGDDAAGQELASPSTREALATTRRRDDIVQKIRDAIRSRSLGPGDRLPGERQLASEFGVSRGSIREAIQFLATLGVVQVRHGGGTFLRVPGGEVGSQRLHWRSWVERNRDRILEVLEVRMGAETFAVELAARRAGPEDLERLVGVLQRMKTATQECDMTAVMQCDLAFHEALVLAAGNRTLRDLLQTLGEELVPSRGAVLELEGRIERSYSEHLAIYEAIQAGNSAAAAAAMKVHLESVQRDVLDGLLSDESLALEEGGIT